MSTRWPPITAFSCWKATAGLRVLQWTLAGEQLWSTGCSSRPPLTSHGGPPSAASDPPGDPGSSPCRVVGRQAQQCIPTDNPRRCLGGGGGTPWLAITQQAAGCLRGHPASKNQRALWLSSRTLSAAAGLRAQRTPHTSFHRALGALVDTPPERTSGAPGVPVDTPPQALACPWVCW